MEFLNTGQLGMEFLEAPLRLGTESYEAFAAQLHVGQEDAQNSSVVEELRRLQIDPEVFYRDARRLGVCRFSSDDWDPAGTEPAMPMTSSAGPGSSKGSSAGVDPTTCPDSPGQVEEPNGLRWRGLSALRQASDHPVPGGWAFKPPAREVPLQPDEESTEEPWGPVPANVALHPGLNVPQHEEEEDPPYEEISLEADAGETRGGRIGHETPRGLSAKLQIDSLTDDGDEVDFRGPVLEEGDPNEEDEVEAFTLDPDFDYDNVDNLTRRV